MERHLLRRLKDKVDRPWHLMLLLSFSIHHLSLSGHTAYHLLLRKKASQQGEGLLMVAVIRGQMAE